MRSADVAKLRDDWLKQANPFLKLATVLRRLVVLSHVFSIARKEWGIENLSNPVELCTQTTSKQCLYAAIIEVEVEPRYDRRAADGKLQRVISASGSEMLPTIICLAVGTAMRCDEISPRAIETRKEGRKTSGGKGAGDGCVFSI
ncbi:hypothetical protein [Mycetohabitans sp. B46]|uniref:hypothetical protein n=1 Tax=Mycetohabitans sp. B46 TaxID=2772536 RepID=UPI00307D3452